LSGCRLIDAEIKAIIETTEGKRLQVSFGNETARIYDFEDAIVLPHKALAVQAINQAVEKALDLKTKKLGWPPPVAFSMEDAGFPSIKQQK
jgi:hypothetical protein